MAVFDDIDGVTVRNNLTVNGTLIAAGIPTLNGATLTVNADAAAGTDQDPALALMGGDGGTEVIKSVLGQDSSADKMFLRMYGGAAGTTEKAATLHLGGIGTTANVGSTLTLEAGNGSTNKPVTLANSAGALTDTASAGVNVVNTTSGNILLDNQATTGEIRMDLGTDTSATAFKVRNNSGTTLFSVDGAGTITPSTSVSRQVLERDSGISQGTTNTNILRFTNAVAAAGSGCFTFTDSASDGSYITASTACMVTVNTTLNRGSGTLWIKAGASLSNTVSATDTDIKAVADYATANEGASATFYMAANDKAWVALSAAPGGSYPRLNRLMVSAVAI
jgi:hypothetical protein